MKSDIWHVAHEMWHMEGGEDSVKISGLPVKVQWRFGRQEQGNNSLNHKGVCTQGLLLTLWYVTIEIYLGHQFMYKKSHVHKILGKCFAKH